MGLSSLFERFVESALSLELGTYTSLRLTVPLDSQPSCGNYHIGLAHRARGRRVYGGFGEIEYGADPTPDRIRLSIFVLERLLSPENHRGLPPDEAQIVLESAVAEWCDLNP